MPLIGEATHAVQLDELPESPGDRRARLLDVSRDGGGQMSDVVHPYFDLEVAHGVARKIREDHPIPGAHLGAALLWTGLTLTVVQMLETVALLLGDSPVGR
jgi:hypothetical protein